MSLVVNEDSNSFLELFMGNSVSAEFTGKVVVVTDLLAVDSGSEKLS